MNELIRSQEKTVNDYAQKYLLCDDEEYKKRLLERLEEEQEKLNFLREKFKK
jgi:hypothetical protein